MTKLVVWSLLVMTAGGLSMLYLHLSLGSRGSPRLCEGMRDRAQENQKP